tara:strand:- start:8 stop:205 length:198 start_codon:yes stop_codon:yes gene_type:complete
MKVEQYTENEDGSATLVVDLTPEETAVLLESAIVQAIKEYLDKKERENPEEVVKRGNLPSNSFEL